MFNTPLTWIRSQGIMRRKATESGLRDTSVTAASRLSLLDRSSATTGSIPAVAAQGGTPAGSRLLRALMQLLRSAPAGNATAQTSSASSGFLLMAILL